MYKETTIASINNVDIPNPLKSKFNLKRSDKYKEYELEDGTKRVDIIRENIFSGSVSYSGLFESDIRKIENAITIVSDMSVYDAKTGRMKTFKALITNVSLNNITMIEGYHAWSLSFDFEEIDRLV